jgi:predicted transcriptional regulator
LLNFIEDQPGLTGWELSEKTGIPYTDATKGLAKLREFRAVRTESEERETGGFRYRYRPIDDFQAHAAFVEAVRRVEGLQ